MDTGFRKGGEDFAQRQVVTIAAKSGCQSPHIRLIHTERHSHFSVCEEYQTSPDVYGWSRRWRYSRRVIGKGIPVVNSGEEITQVQVVAQFYGVSCLWRQPGDHHDFRIAAGGRGQQCCPGEVGGAVNNRNGRPFSVVSSNAH